MRTTFFIFTMFLTAPISALTVPFQESFDNDPANWASNSGLLDVDYFSTGGVDGGGYISDEFSYENLQPDDQGPVLFRGRAQLGASGNAFVGDWIAGNVDQFTFSVRHDTTDPVTGAPIPVNFFARFASPINFPGGTAIEFVPVLPGQWTEISIDITDGLPPFGPFVSYEDSDFQTIFSNIGEVQVGVSIPSTLAGSTNLFRYDLDSAGITAIPAPTGTSWMAAGLLGLVCRQRRMKRAVR